MRFRFRFSEIQRQFLHPSGCDNHWDFNVSLNLWCPYTKTNPIQIWNANANLMCIPCVVRSLWLIGAWHGSPGVSSSSLSWSRSWLRESAMSWRSSTFSALVSRESTTSSTTWAPWWPASSSCPSKRASTSSSPRCWSAAVTSGVRSRCGRLPREPAALLSRQPADAVGLGSAGGRCRGGWGPAGPAEAGAGDWSDHQRLWLRLLSPGVGHLRWLSAEQWGRYASASAAPSGWAWISLLKPFLFLSFRTFSTQMLQLLCSPACRQRRHRVFCVCRHEPRRGWPVSENKGRQLLCDWYSGKSDIGLPILADKGIIKE